MRRFLSVLAAAILSAGLAHADAARWPEAKANAWYGAQPWPLGSNYVPADAINQLEMWQGASFDPKRIDLELGWAEKLGMNTMRVFLHDLLWAQDPKGFSARLDTFLAIAAKHHIKPVFVLFNSCWDPNPKLGPQHPHSRCAQFGLGAVARHQGARRPRPGSPARSLCERRGRPFCAG